MSQQINLYNAAFVPKRQWLTATNLALATAALYAALAMAGVWAHHDAKQKEAAASAVQARQKQAQEAFQALKTAHETRKPSAALQAEIARRESVLAARDAILAELAKGQGDARGGAGYGELLRGLARQSREGIWLTGVSAEIAGRALSLQGRTVDKALVADYLRRLNAEPVFAGRAFAGLRMGQPGTTGGAEERAGEVRSTAPTAPLISVTAPAAGMQAAARIIEFQLQAEEISGKTPPRASEGGGGVAPFAEKASIVDAVVNSPLNPARR